MVSTNLWWWFFKNNPIQNKWNLTSSISSIWWMGLENFAICSVSIAKEIYLKILQIVLNRVLKKVRQIRKLHMLKIISLPLKNESFRNINVIQDGLYASMTLLFKISSPHIFQWEPLIDSILKRIISVKINFSN